MKPLWLALILAALGLAPAQAQTVITMPPPAGIVIGGLQVVTTCGTASLTAGQVAVAVMDHTGVLCSSASGGGGGGLSVVDQTSWVQGTSAFTPSGGVFNDTATLSTGTEGTFRLTTKRAQIVDADTTGNALYTAITSSIVTGPNRIGYTSDDLCTQGVKTSKNINTASGTTLLVAASGSTKVYICSFAVIAPTAVSVSLSEGTGATCNTANQAGMMGVAVNGTAANGMAFAANGGMTYGNGGATVTQTATAGNAVCLFQSGTAQLAGNIMYVQQ